MKREPVVSFMVLLLTLFALPPAFADSIKLKNGKSVEGVIIERNAQSVRVNLSGIPLTYYIDEIESINGEKIVTEKLKSEPKDTLAQIPSGQRVVGEDRWDAFLKFSEQFYYLDTQNITDISCDISVAFIKDLLSTMEAQLKGFEKNLIVTNNLDMFRLRFDKEKGLTFTLPQCDIKIISEEGMADPAKVKSGISAMKTGFDKAAKGASEIIRGVFESYRSPRRSEYEIIEMSESEKGAKVIYKHKGNTVHSLHSGTHCESTQTNGTMTLSVIEDYKKVDGKLLLDKGFMSMQQGAQHMTSTIIVEYQQIGSIYFPSKISNDTKVSLGGMTSDIPIEIVFTNIKIN